MMSRALQKAQLAEAPDSIDDMAPEDFGLSRQSYEDRGCTPLSRRMRKTDRVRVVADVPWENYPLFVVRCMDHSIPIIREQLRDGDTTLYTLELGALTEAQVDRAVDLAVMCGGRCRISQVYERPREVEV